MAELTLGQMLDAALKDPKTEPIDFDQLRNLLSGMLGRLDLKEELLQDTLKASSDSMTEDLKRREEANERAIAEIRALLDEFCGDMKEMKQEQSLLAENLQQMGESLDLTGVMEKMYNNLLNTLMSALSVDGQLSWLQTSGRDSSGMGSLMVIGNEIMLGERPRIAKSRQRDTQSRARTLSRNNTLNRSTSSLPVSHTASDVGHNDMEQSKDEEVKMGISKAEALTSPKEFSRGKNLLHRTTSRNQVSFMKSDTGWNDVEQVKDEAIKNIISKALPHVQTKNSDDSFTGLGISPGFPSTQSPVQEVQSAQDHPASQTVWIPAESVAGTNTQFQNKTSQEYLPSYKPFTTQFPGLGPPSRSSSRPGHSDVLNTLQPPPRLTTHQDRKREQADTVYSRRAPMYCGGRHTSSCPVQPMKPLLPDPNKPGKFDLVGKDGLVYRGRQ